MLEDLACICIGIVASTSLLLIPSKLRILHAIEAKLDNALSVFEINYLENESRES
ncbi:hypothetical protein PHSC3_001716 [Chlamydiales bacterium STE3]|nr:hypothetical protein PHSC3_001716 [Chlamydiales bacterium STE3]